MQNKLLRLLFVFSGFFLFSPASAERIVSSVSELLQAVIDTRHGGDLTIIIRDGYYHLSGQYMRITVNGVTIRSQSGDRDSVILDGHYQSSEIFQIVASDITIADLTLKRAKNHPVHISGGNNSDVMNVLLDNLHIIDPGEQAIKINASGRYKTTTSVIKNSLIELTSAGRNFVEHDRSNSHPCYTGGIDAHKAIGWTIQNNEIRGFWCSSGLSEHAIHFWDNSSDTIVERNLIFDCDRGIGFGLGKKGHNGGIIRNNMISQIKNHSHSDVGIGLESATGAKIYNNTVFLAHDYPNAIEYRFTKSNNLTIINNLSNRSITSKNGASAIHISHNVTNAAANWFQNVTTGDLHLSKRQKTVIDSGLKISGLNDDFDKQFRPHHPDIGADEYSQ